MRTEKEIRDRISEIQFMNHCVQESLCCLDETNIDTDIFSKINEIALNELKWVLDERV